jgi:hypothetical protein
MKQPLKRFKAGQVVCALWSNEVNIKGRNVSVLKATVERKYKDNQGNWQSSQSFGRADIPLVRWCLDQAFSAMIEERSSQVDAVEEDVSA